MYEIQVQHMHSMPSIDMQGIAVNSYCRLGTIVDKQTKVTVISYGIGYTVGCVLCYIGNGRLYMQ